MIFAEDSNNDQLEFDTIVGCIEDIVIGEKFQDLQVQSILNAITRIKGNSCLWICQIQFIFFTFATFGTSGIFDWIKLRGVWWEFGRKQIDIHGYFSGKNEILVNSETTCSTDGNEITSVTDTDEPSCISRCDLTPECGYSFYGEDNSCSLYHTCDEREEITTIGTTYQKLGNGNDILGVDLQISNFL